MYLRCALGLVVPRRAEPSASASASPPGLVAVPMQHIGDPSPSPSPNPSPGPSPSPNPSPIPSPNPSPRSSPNPNPNPQPGDAGCAGVLEPFEAKLHLVLTRAPRVRGWVRARVNTPRVPRSSLECHAAAPSTYGCRRHHIRSQALLHTVAGSLTYGCRLHLVASVLGCAAQLLRIDAIVPVRCRAVWTVWPVWPAG